MKVKPEEEERFKAFVEINHYLAGSYDQKESFVALNEKVLEITKQTCPKSCEANRIFYLALPPTVYSSVTELISHNCKAKK